MGRKKNRPDIGATGCSFDPQKIPSGKGQGKCRFCTILNVSRKKSVHARMEIADSEFSKTRGLMFRKNVIPILFIFNSPGIYPIHSFFVPGVFDAVYLSEKGKTTDVFRNITPGKPFICPTKKASYLLELPSALALKLGIKQGDVVLWEWEDKG